MTAEPCDASGSATTTQASGPQCATTTSPSRTCSVNGYDVDAGRLIHRPVPLQICGGLPVLLPQRCCQVLALCSGPHAEQLDQVLPLPATCGVYMCDVPHARNGRALEHHHQVRTPAASCAATTSHPHVHFHPQVPAASHVRSQALRHQPHDGQGIQATRRRFLPGLPGVPSLGRAHVRRHRKEQQQPQRRRRQRWHNGQQCSRCGCGCRSWCVHGGRVRGGCAVRPVCRYRSRRAHFEQGPLLRVRPGQVRGQVCFVAVWPTW